jgi:hypothetical protein
MPARQPVPMALGATLRRGLTKFEIVFRWIPAAFARSESDQFTAARAILTCAGVTTALRQPLQACQSPRLLEACDLVVLSLNVSETCLGYGQAQREARIYTRAALRHTRRRLLGERICQLDQGSGPTTEICEQEA